MSVDTFFLVDGGASKTVAELRNLDGEVLFSMKDEASALSRPSKEVIKIFTRLYENATSNANRLGFGFESQNCRWVVGLAGLTIPGALDTLKAAMPSVHSTIYCNDGFLSLVGARNFNPGIVASIGTGSIVWCLSQKLEASCVGGWGFPVGDEGSGAWMGLKITSDLFKALDGQSLSPEPSAKLVNDIYQHIGGAGNLLGWSRTATSGSYAALAKYICSAVLNDDPYAKSLLEQASLEIRKLIEFLDPEACLNTSLLGGLSPIMLPYLKQHMPTRRFDEPVGNAIDGAFKIGSNIIDRSRTGDIGDFYNLPRGRDVDHVL